MYVRTTDHGYKTIAQLLRNFKFHISDQHKNLNCGIRVKFRDKTSNIES